jgi:glycerophosphoryl diester phosphodiesterase
VASIIQLQRSGEMNKATWAIAQRRGSCEGPENIMAAFRGVIELGAGYIEADIQLTSDGQFVCI